MKRSAMIALMEITVLVSASLAQDAEILADVKVDYGFAAWVGTTVTNYSSLVTNWIPNFSEIGVTNHVWSRVGTYTNSTKDSQYDFAPTNDSSVIVSLQIMERDCVSNAHEALVSNLSRCSLATIFPDNSLVGDKCLVYRTNSPACLWFSRNNVCIALSANNTNYSVFGVAATFDHQLLNISTNQE